MIVAVSGYNASGKSTLVAALTSRLTAAAVPCRSMKFDSLYPSKWITRKRKRVAAPDQKGNLGLRNLEGQRGDWDRPIGLKQVADICAAATMVLGLRLWTRRQVIVFDRYFCDRLVSFSTAGWLHGLALRVIPRPDMAFVLSPNPCVWERRIVERARARFGLELDELAAGDREELQLVQSRYRVLLDREPRVHWVDSADDASVERAIDRLLARVYERRSGVL